MLEDVKIQISESQKRANKFQLPQLHLIHNYRCVQVLLPRICITLLRSQDADLCGGRNRKTEFQNEAARAASYCSKFFEGVPKDFEFRYSPNIEYDRMEMALEECKMQGE